MPNRPRLLFLCQNAPYPPHGGQQIRSLHTLRILAGTFEVAAALFFRRSLNPTPESRARAQKALEEYGQARLFEIPQEYGRIRLGWDHLRSILGRRAYVRWAYESREFRTHLIKTLREFRPEIIHLDSLDLVAYLPLCRSYPTVVSHHNIESSLLSRRGKVIGGARGRYLAHQARLTQAEEKRWCPQVDLNLVVSNEDGATLERVAPGSRWELFPNGVDTLSFRPAAAEPEGDIVFVGGHTWFPNTDGMEYFASEILPRIKQVFPDARTRWVGRAPEDVIARFKARGVEMTGYVDDIRDYVWRARCFIVPLRIGGGTRLKILDAWALGKAVVATSLGCEGLSTRDGQNLLVADTPQQFADRVIQVLRDEGLRKRLEAEGRRTAELEYDWAVLGEKLIPSYRKLLQDSRNPEPGDTVNEEPCRQ